MGVRRQVKGADVLAVASSSGALGPGEYEAGESAKAASGRREEPKWSIPRGPKLGSSRSDASLYQTYASSSAVGTQVRAGKVSRPKYSINKTSRESGGLVLRAHMEFRPAPVRMPHPII